MKINPYRIDTPGIISFSGGRTSGYMLRMILDAFGGQLPDGIKVVFCNTGKERPETLDFVERCSIEWDVPIAWLEYRYESGPTFAMVDYATASRDGEPLEAAIVKPRSGTSGYLPNPITRYCTIETKIKTAIRYAKSLGWEQWTNAVGFRADEPQRVAKLKASIREQCEDAVAPLAKAGVTRGDVNAWWDRQPFQLDLLPHEGNCDLCFLKGKGLILEILQRKPELADWWIRMEERGGRFRNDRPSYENLQTLAQRPTLFDDFEPDELSIACHCSD